MAGGAIRHADVKLGADCGTDRRGATLACVTAIGPLGEAWRRVSVGSGKATVTGRRGGSVDAGATVNAVKCGSRLSCPHPG